MSVLIKGMEMPERCGCGRCHFVRWSNLHQTAWCTLAQEACFEDFSNDYKNRRADFCPLVEIPTQHGRLGDLDALYAEISNGNKAYNGIEGYDGEHPNIANVDDCLDAIKYADAVIEAEGSET